MANSITEKNKSVLAPVDIYETKNEYILKLDMPGIKRENISIVLNDGVLELKGNSGDNAGSSGKLYQNEFRSVDYFRSFSVGRDVDSDGISAKSENGVLSVVLKKREQAKPRKIEVIAS